MTLVSEREIALRGVVMSNPGSRRRPPPCLSKVQSTAVEALSGKASVVARGYYSDPYHELLVPQHTAPVRLAPLMNRGEQC
jgi:hypothetical protein